MSIRKLTYLAAAVIAAATAVVVAVIAGAFAGYALLREVMSPAGAAAGVAGIAVLLIVAVTLVMALSGRPSQSREHESVGARALHLARERPLLAVGAAVVVGFFALRNPQFVTTAVTAFMAGKSSPKKK